MLLFLNFDAILIQSKSLNSLGKKANSSRLFNSFRITAILYVSFWNGNCKQRDILMIESMNSLSRQVSIRSEGMSTKYFHRDWHCKPFFCVFFFLRGKHFSKKYDLHSQVLLFSSLLWISSIWLYWHSYSQDTMFWMKWRVFSTYRNVLRCSPY